MGSYENDKPRPHGAGPLRDRQSVRCLWTSQRRGFSFFGEGPSGSDGLVRHRRSRSLRSRTVRTTATPSDASSWAVRTGARILHARAGRRRLARADPSDVQLTTPRPTATRADTHRVLSSLKRASRRSDGARCDSATVQCDGPSARRASDCRPGPSHVVPDRRTLVLDRRTPHHRPAGPLRHYRLRRWLLKNCHITAVVSTSTFVQVWPRPSMRIMRTSAAPHPS